MMTAAEEEVFVRLLFQRQIIQRDGISEKSQDRLCLLSEITVSASNYFLPRYVSFNWGFKRVNSNYEGGSRN
ncbi:hypothetical protein E4659_09345 [Dickeya dianthicola]|uniref:hypothetical protein n=1 Tax=Dickeya dianthicola TaxID=204039 RepID=UPI00039F58A8|nr:hypothetical protein [Dickeya dianthicola]ATO32657.1 hypothetical protein DDI_1489 [Dickeya dianthicola RNS04.9]MBI0439847.1 hypothetical protein [Dickeya dianthicola]MBI0451257.1 hypothetical protein [Dickeya dianthicola]MBI0455675.1 hypothetical protein [Dickeya dianthicola]MBI0459382.1 hypothetical protein [Dickeya dianthicola]